ncbi:Eukaryotic translation initiation factor 2 gamma subunit [Spironucleus salmonicida]|uniref:protein-synthesizing GTPase n=1 Tax=Spironucleus salmonicida TaxID=348837 RepID=V6LCP3_9EUKA|nr:Eukaryotic translation initiation factor 2 gamma subunit [Spironucleus salmonicida]|eukprot:EST42023.1 Eukaryotic translation initiation factor 2 gamma subunit [Spironucleus salmonicida]
MPLHPTNLPDQTAPVSEIHPLHPQITARQATLNIGTIGHVAHGKSSLCRSLSGVNTVRFESEKEHNVTIRLGYANCKIFTCESCPEPHNVFSFNSAAADPKCPNCKQILSLTRHISIIDCPGHDEYMTTMLSGAAIMDGTILLVAGNEQCPQSQTVEHLQAIAIQGDKPVVICQNKIDLIAGQVNAAEQNMEQITNFVKGTIAEKAPIIPTSAVRGLNVDMIAYHLSKIPIPDRKLDQSPIFTIIRSFDVNKSGSKPENLSGGVVGGTLSQGILKIGDIVEIRPGIIEIDGDNIKCYPLKTKIVSLKTEDNELNYAIPGGLIAVGTLLDPSITKSDRLVGQVLGIPGSLPPIMRRLKISFHELQTSIIPTGFMALTQEIFQIDQSILLTVSGCNSTAKIESVNFEGGKIQFVVNLTDKPVCVGFGTYVAVSVKNAKLQSRNWRLIGYGVIVNDEEIYKEVFIVDENEVK